MAQVPEAVIVIEPADMDRLLSAVKGAHDAMKCLEMRVNCLEGSLRFMMGRIGDRESVVEKRVEQLERIATNPPPIPNDYPSIHDEVARDIMRRKEAGLNKYGTLLQPHNGRDALKDLYEEILDAACYLKQWLMENPS